MAETGIFPSYTNRPDRQGGKVRRMHAGRPLNELRVKSIKDGMVRSIVDDGMDKNGPGQARQELLRKISAIDPQTGLPLFYVDQRVPPIQGPGGLMVPVAVLNDEIKAAQDRYIAEREARSQSALAQFEAAKRAAAQAVLTEAAAPEIKSPKARPGRPRKVADDG